MPLSFTQNNGQWEEQALFRAHAGGASFWFTNEKVYYQFTRRIPLTPAPLPQGEGNSESVFPADAGIQTSGGLDEVRFPLNKGGPRGLYDPFDRFSRDDDSIATLVLTASFIGANPNPEIAGVDLMDYKCNYFLGNVPENWHTDVPNYKAVVYKESYPGIDLKYYGNGDGKIEYDFIIKPGADPSQIAIRYDGAEAICVDERGQLVVETAWGEVTECTPVAYQTDGENQILIRGEYLMIDEKTFGFSIIDEYQPQLAVVIDPVLSYSTYLGGGSDDYGYHIAVDSSGNAYVTGHTNSSNFPTEGPFQTYQFGPDVFVAKLSNSGNSLIYSTYLGGGGSDFGFEISVDGSGNVYITGFTSSSDFPTQNPYQTDQGVADVFVTKLNDAICGDADGSGSVDVSDAVYLIQYIFSGGPAPNPLLAGDADCSGTVDISDAVYLIQFIFSGGPAPCAGC